MNTKLCGCCKLIIRCKYCNEEFEAQDIRNTDNAIKNKLPIDSFCSLKCSNNWRNRQPYMIKAAIKNGTNRGRQAASLIGKISTCKICKNESKIVDISGRCEKCCKLQNQNTINRSKLKGKCTLCGKINNIRDQNGRGKSDCNCSSNWYRNHNSSDKMKEISIKNLANFIKPANFIELNGIEYFLDHKTNEYIVWEDYKKEFITNSIDFNPVNIIDDGYTIIPTFREQSSITWGSASSAFEKNLADMNIKWFSYIKFAIKEDKDIFPLVVGKSGSKLVNISGSDVSFSTKIEHGPSRRFLKENNINWFKESIAIKAFDKESEALKQEFITKRKYNLFFS